VAAAARTGAYLTRGRAAELERQLAELEGRLSARLDALEAEVHAARGLPLELLKRETAVKLELYRELVSEKRKGEPT
jgi:hypothetical protein